MEKSVNTVAMRGRSQAVVAILVACAVMVILISPEVASPAGTLTSKHSLQPPQVAAPLGAALLLATIYHPVLVQEMVLPRPSHPIASDVDLVDLTTARLC